MRSFRQVGPTHPFSCRHFHTPFSTLISNDNFYVIPINSLVDLRNTSLIFWSHAMA